MRASFFLATAVLLAGCATVPPGNPPETYDLIAFDLASWGRPVERWTIGPTGEGAYVDRHSENYAPYAPFRLDTHEIAVGSDGYARLASLVRDLPDPAPAYESCTEQMSDATYGTLRLTSGAETREIAFNTGCLSGPYRDFTAQLQAINALVAGWGKDAPVTRSEEFNTDR